MTLQQPFYPLKKLSFSLGLMAVSVFLVFASVRFPEGNFFARAFAAETAGRFASVLRAPLSFTRSLSAAHTSQDIALRQKLTFQEQELSKLRSENRQLKRMAAILPASPSYTTVVAQVMTDDGSPFTHSVLINAGMTSGLVNGQEVYNEDGLVGRIVETFPATARVMLLTDPSFRLPVRLAESRVRALISGTSAPLLDFVTVETAAPAFEGQLVVTSDMNGTLIPEIPVGRLVMTNGTPHIKPLFQPSSLDMVTVARHPVRGIF